MEIKTILWREWLFLKHRFVKITLGQLVTPLLYLLTFGIGIGGGLMVEGRPYIFFLVPGILSMATMRNSYTAIATRISITRLHEKSFECFVYSPTRMSGLVIGYVLAGALRGMYAGVFVIAIGLFAGAGIVLNGWLILAMLLNAVIFSSLGFFAAMVINTHYDLNNFNSMIITPMTFLCGTFFSLNNMPLLIRWLIELLPLTHTTKLIRQIALGEGADPVLLLVVVLFALMFILLCIRVCYREIKD